MYCNQTCCMTCFRRYWCCVPFGKRLLKMDLKSRREMVYCPQARVGKMWRHVGQRDARTLQAFPEPSGPKKQTDL